MPLHFCPDCQNMLTFAQQDQELLVRCRTCGYEGPCQETVLHTQSYRQGGDVGLNRVREDVIYDSTLKRTIHYQCPNADCATHTDSSKKEAVFVRDTNVNLQQAMVCCSCRTKWRI